MATAIRSVVGKLGSKYSSCCHSKGRTVANMIRVGDFQMRSSVVNNYNIDRDVLFSISKPPPSYGYSARHPFLLGNHQKKAPPLVPDQYCKLSHRLYGGAVVAPYSMDNPDTTALANFAVKECNKEKNAQLQLVRVLSVWYQTSGRLTAYFLKMEAVEEGVVKVYQALVFSSCGKTELQLFGLLKVDNGSLLKLTFKRPTTAADEGLPDFRDHGYVKRNIPRKTSRNCPEEEILSTLLHMSPLR